VGYERAIVTELAGTTRDAIEAPVSCDGFPFRLVDTAGIRESEDAVERLGVDVSRRYVGAADVVLLCVEANRDMSGEEAAFRGNSSAPVVTVRTKVDLIPDGAAEWGGVPVSALTGTGLTELRSALAAVAFSGKLETADAEPELTRARHRTALTQAKMELEKFLEAFGSGVESVVAAVHLRSAVAALEEIVGVVTTDDVLDAVFSEFCIGK
jgi:tRNA modification GTPase